MEFVWLLLFKWTSLWFNLDLSCVFVFMTCVDGLSCRDWIFPPIIWRWIRAGHFVLELLLAVEGHLRCFWFGAVWVKPSWSSCTGFLSRGSSFLWSAWQCLAFEDAPNFPSIGLLTFVIKVWVNVLCTVKYNSWFSFFFSFPSYSLSCLFVCLFSRAKSWIRGSQMPGMYPTTELHS